MEVGGNLDNVKPWYNNDFFFKLRYRNYFNV